MLSSSQAHFVCFVKLIPLQKLILHVFARSQQLKDKIVHTLCPDVVSAAAADALWEIIFIRYQIRGVFSREHIVKKDSTLLRGEKLNYLPPKLRHELKKKN